MEVQLTDYENAAYAVFIVLLTRAIMSLGLNFYLPISKVRFGSFRFSAASSGATLNSRIAAGAQVDENMHRAHRRDAIHTQKFFFRKNLFNPKPGHACDPPLDTPLPASASLSATANGTSLPQRPNGISSHTRESSAASVASSAPSPGCSSHNASRATSPLPTPAFGPVEDEYAEFTINEIFNGDGKDFPGLIGVIRLYLKEQEKEGKVSEEVKKGVERSLDLVKRRADGTSTFLFPLFVPSLS
jgi:glutamate--cysteine ligase catalytic subunit